MHPRLRLDAAARQEEAPVMIRTLFGVVAAAAWFPGLRPEDLVQDEMWRRAVKAEGGPFCLTPLEREIPF